MSFKPIINLFSILVMFFSLSFVLPMVVSLIYKDSALSIFSSTFFIVFGLGAFGWFASKGSKKELDQNDGFILSLIHI